MDSKHRHALKQDEFTNTLWNWSDTIAARRRLVAGLAVALVAVLVIAAGWLTWRARQANEAGALLGVAMATASSPIVPTSSVAGATQTAGTFPTEQARAEAALEAFNVVIAEAPGTEAARTAAYHAASALMAAGRLDEAERAFAAIAESEGTSIRGQSARLGQAEALVALGRTD